MSHGLSHYKEECPHCGKKVDVRRGRCAVRRYLMAVTKRQLYALGACMDSAGDLSAHTGSKIYTAEAAHAGEAIGSALGFSKDDFERIDAALRLRSEACEENGDKKEARRWETVRKKLEAAARGGA